MWTYNNVCEVMDSYALPLESYEVQPLIDWIEKYWTYVVTNGKSLQAVQDHSRGHYALIHLKERARGRFLQDFLNLFSKHDYVENDHKVGQMLKTLIRDEVAWNKVCKSCCHQQCQ